MDTVRIINVSFQIWGSVLSIVVMLCLLLSGRKKTKCDILYFGMLGSNVGAMLMDTMAFYFRGDESRLGWFAVRMTNYSQFVFSNLLGLTFLIYLKKYIEEYLDTKISSKITYSGVMLFIVSVCMLTVNLIHPFFYDFDSGNIYSRLPHYPLMYIPLYTISVIAIILIVKYHNKLSRLVIVSFALYVAVPAVSMICSILVYGITFGYLGATTILTALFLYLQFEQNKLAIQKNAINKVAEIKGYEKLVNQGIKIAMEDESPDVNLNIMMQYLGEMLKGDRAYIFEKDENNCDDNTYEWCAEGIVPQIDVLQNVPPEICKGWYDTFKSENVVIIKDIEDIKESDPLVYETLKPQNVTSLVTFPLCDKQKTIGFFGVDNPPKEVLHMTKDILEITSSFIVSLIKKRNMVRELKRLSYTDAATGAGNRHAMFTHFETIRHKKDIGIIFCDITGLKEVNDTQGHSAGDELIKNTYKSIAKAFGAIDIFRIGGDEFVVMCCGIKEEELRKRIEIIRSALSERKVNAAIGFEWRERVADNVEHTIVKAETEMYAEKSRWYQQTGREKRRR